MNATPVDARLAEAAQQAINAAGGGSALAKQLGVTKSAVWQWKRSGIPPLHVGRVSKIVGCDPHLIRPDLFEPMAVAADQVAA